MAGHKLKKEHGVGILLAPHIQIQSYDIHLQARILSVRAIVRGVRIAILNVYAPTDANKSDATKQTFYAALIKAKAELVSQPKYKLIVLGVSMQQYLAKAKIQARGTRSLVITTLIV